MQIKITYKNGMIKEVDTSTFTVTNPDFIKNDSGVKYADNQMIATDVRIRWDLMQKYGLIAEIYYWDNNYHQQLNDKVMIADYNKKDKLYLATYRPAKAMQIVRLSELNDVVEILQDGETKIWRDIDGNLINFDNVNRIEKVQQNYTKIADSYSYLENKWSEIGDEENPGHNNVVRSLRKIELLLGIEKGRLSQILKEKSEFDRKQRLKDAQQQAETEIIRNTSIELQEEILEKELDKEEQESQNLSDEEKDTQEQGVQEHKDAQTGTLKNVATIEQKQSKEDDR